MDETENPRPVSAARLSKTPSWIMLGFVLGAVVVGSWRVESGRKSPPPASLPEPPPVRLERPHLTEIEAVFAIWGRFAIWRNDVTEVALWDRDKHAFSIFYEVLRSGDDFYFRTIPQLTRPLLDHGIDPQSPLRFTETEETRRERLQQEQLDRSRPATP